MLKDYAYLYVEDDQLSRQVMETIMRTVLGVKHFTMFEDSADFMARLKALPRRPDVILLDIHLDPLDGFALLDLIRREPEYRDTQIVALTASVMNEEVNRLRNSGFNGAIAKPLSVQAFPRLLESIVRRQAVWHIF